MGIGGVGFSGEWVGKEIGKCPGVNWDGGAADKAELDWVLGV